MLARKQSSAHGDIILGKIRSKAEAKAMQMAQSGSSSPGHRRKKAYDMVQRRRSSVQHNNGVVEPGLHWQSSSRRISSSGMLIRRGSLSPKNRLVAISPKKSAPFVVGMGRRNSTVERHRLKDMKAEHVIKERTKKFDDKFKSRNLHRVRSRRMSSLGLAQDLQPEYQNARGDPDSPSHLHLEWGQRRDAQSRGSMTNAKIVSLQ